MTVANKFHWNGDGTFTIEAVQDVEPILEHNKVLQGAPQDRKSGFRHVASIPVIFLEKWSREEGVDYMRMPRDEFAKRIKLKLADPDYRWLRAF